MKAFLISFELVVLVGPLQFRLVYQGIELSRTGQVGTAVALLQCMIRTFKFSRGLHSVIAMLVGCIVNTHRAHASCDITIILCKLIVTAVPPLDTHFSPLCASCQGGPGWYLL
jgi:hypothetical protein